MAELNTSASQEDLPPQHNAVPEIHPNDTVSKTHLVNEDQEISFNSAPDLNNAYIEAALLDIMM
ncbi:hypothetical protein FQN50_008067, partial [Emmonsiellopsis sp. PD_5]